MKLVLHIGTEKTGSTSIQAFLMKNRGAFLKEGFFYRFSTLPPYGTGNQRYFPFFDLKVLFTHNLLRHL